MDDSEPAPPMGFVLNLINSFQKTVMGFTSSALYGVALGAGSFLALKLCGIDSQPLGLKREVYWFMLCVPWMAAVRFCMTRRATIRQKFVFLKQLSEDGLLPLEVYEVVVKSYADYYVKLDTGQIPSPPTKKRSAPSGGGPPSGRKTTPTLSTPPNSPKDAKPTIPPELPKQKKAPNQNIQPGSSTDMTGLKPSESGLHFG